MVQSYSRFGPFRGSVQFEVRYFSRFGHSRIGHFRAPVIRGSVLFEVQSFEVRSFEFRSFDVQSFEVWSFEVWSFEVRSRFQKKGLQEILNTFHATLEHFKAQYRKSKKCPNPENIRSLVCSPKIR